MTDSTNSPGPGVYVKGDSERVANTAAKAVALVFDGYKLKTDEVPESAPTDTATGPSSTSATPDTPSGTPADVPAVPRPPRGATTTTTTP